MNTFYSNINDDDGVEILQEQPEVDIETIVSSTSQQRQQRDDCEESEESSNRTSKTDCVISRTISFAIDHGGREQIIGRSRAISMNEDSSCSDEYREGDGGCAADHIRSSSIDSSTTTTTTSSSCSKQPPVSSPFSISSFQPSSPFVSASSSRSKKRKVAINAPFTPPRSVARGIFRRSSSFLEDEEEEEPSPPSMLTPPLFIPRNQNSYYDHHSQKRICLFDEHNARNHHGDIDLSFLSFPTLRHPHHHHAPHDAPHAPHGHVATAATTTETPPQRSPSPLIHHTPTPQSQSKANTAWLSPRTTLTPRFYDIPELELMRGNSLFNNYSEDEDEDESEDEEYDSNNTYNVPTSPSSTAPSLTTRSSFDGDHEEDRLINENENYEDFNDNHHLGNVAHCQLNKSPAFDSEEEESNGGRREGFVSSMGMKRRRAPPIAPRTNLPRASPITRPLFNSFQSLPLRMTTPTTPTTTPTMMQKSPMYQTTTTNGNPNANNVSPPSSFQMRPRSKSQDNEQHNSSNNRKMIDMMTSPSSTTSAPSTTSSSSPSSVPFFPPLSPNDAHSQQQQQKEEEQHQFTLTASVA